SLDGPIRLAWHGPRGCAGAWRRSVARPVSAAVRQAGAGGGRHAACAAKGAEHADHARQAGAGEVWTRLKEVKQCQVMWRRRKRRGPAWRKHASAAMAL